MSVGSLSLVLPLVLLTLAAAVILLFFHKKVEETQAWAGRIAHLGLLGALVALAAIWPELGEVETALSGLLVLDGTAGLGLAICLLGGFVSVGILGEYLRRRDWNLAEIHVLMLFAVCGMSVMMMTTHLAVIFIGLEVMSLCLYVLSACLRDDIRSVEAGVKYFLTGAFASGLMLMGMAILYGMTTSLELPEVAEGLRHLHGGNHDLALTGAILLLSGFGFKIAAVPFHQWAPDVYEGAPTPVTGFMSTTVKVAAFVPMMRAVMVLEPFADQLVPMLGTLAVVTMLVGNTGALKQASIKRMLAYSSIAHAGYLLLGICAIAGGGRELAVEAILVYLAAYAVMNIGAFGVLSVLESRDGDAATFDSIAGLKQRHPVLAASMLLFLLSLAGIPPTAGFVGKWKIFAALGDRLDETGDRFFGFLALMLALNSVIALGYYLKVVMAMYMKPAQDEFRPATWPRVITATLITICAVMVVWLGIGPNILGIGVDGLLVWVRDAAAGIR